MCGWTPLRVSSPEMNKTASLNCNRKLVSLLILLDLCLPTVALPLNLDKLSAWNLKSAGSD